MPERVDPNIQTQPGRASAEDGLVVLDGPNGIAVTMTADAAIGTGNSLLAAAEIAAAYDEVNDPPATNRADPNDEEPLV